MFFVPVHSIDSLQPRFCDAVVFAFGLVAVFHADGVSGEGLLEDSSFLAIREVNFDGGITHGSFTTWYPAVVMACFTSIRFAEPVKPT